MSDSAATIQFFTGFRFSDLGFLAEAAGNTLLISVIFPYVRLVVASNIY